MESTGTLVLWTSVQAFLEATQEFYLNAEKPKILLSETVREELSVKVPLSSWLTDEESFVGESLSLSLRFTEDTVEVQDVSLAFSILEAEGSAVLSPARPMQMRIDLAVSSLSDAIRKELNTILMMFLQHIPEGAFQFTLDTRDPLSPASDTVFSYVSSSSKQTATLPHLPEAMRE